MIGTSIEFNRCIERRGTKSGRFEIRCKLGLWSVEAPTAQEAEREARHYWAQYHRDGEYNEMLARNVDAH